MLLLKNGYIKESDGLNVKRSGTKKGFSIVEVLTAVAILAVLVGILLGVGSRIKGQADDRLAESGISLIVTALERYYDYHGAFPFEATVDYDQFDLESDTNGVVNTTIGTHLHEYSSSEALCYFLDRTPVSRGMIEKMDSKLMTSKDAGGINLMISIAGGSDTSLVRFVDPWGESLRYTYLVGDNFPVVESAGPDGDFDTQGDNVSSR